MKEITEDVTVSFKFFVPFKDDEEKEAFISKPDTEDDEGAIVEDSRLNIDNLDGKYESQILAFTYKPSLVNPLKRKLDTILFYNFENVPEREGNE